MFVLVGLFTELAAFLIPLGVLLGLLAAMILFGRFAQHAQYSVIEGQPGAAAAVLQGMRGNWTVTPAVTANRNLDVVHRAVGRPGVVLVGEGAPSRVAGLMAAEKKKTERVAHDVPIFEFQVGNDEGQIPVSKLQRKIMRLPAQPAPGRGQRPQLPAEGAPADACRCRRARCRRAPASRRCRGRRSASRGPTSGRRSCRRRGRAGRAGRGRTGSAGMTKSSSTVRSSGPAEAGAAAVGADDADAEQPLADGEPADRGEQVDLEDEQRAGVQYCAAK